MENVSNYVSLGFILTTLITVGLLYKAIKHPKIILSIVFWMVITSILGLTGFYRQVEAIPPRFIFLLPLGLIITLIFSFTKRGEIIIQNADNKWLTVLHVVRIPVEIALYYLYIVGLIPEIMTFEGYNFDIVSGISAPIVFILFFINKRINTQFLLLWNFICLILLGNIVIIALLSAQTPLQRLSLEQPNIGVTYFPFVWLPTVIVPIVLFAHIASIKQLLHKV